MIYKKTKTIQDEEIQVRAARFSRYTIMDKKTNYAVFLIRRPPPRIR
ncbi:hypothetical protein SAMN04488602_101134 [Paenibacillus sp. cl123]|nr:hypothetical protein SAMN04488602_101134 [Paenibacillus sp. cl123]